VSWCEIEQHIRADSYSHNWSVSTRTDVNKCISYVCGKVTIGCCDSWQVRRGRVSSPPSPVCDRYYRPRYTSGTKSFHHHARYVSGMESVSSPPSPICVWYPISPFTTKPVTCLVWNQSLHHQARYVSGMESVSSPPSPICVWYTQLVPSPPSPLRVWYGINLFTTKPIQCQVFSLFTTKPVTCLVWKQSLHHQAQFVSGIQQVSSPPSPLVSRMVGISLFYHQT
jgi:hypothetical protein